MTENRRITGRVMMRAIVGVLLTLVTLVSVPVPDCRGPYDCGYADNAWNGDH